MDAVALPEKMRDDLYELLEGARFSHLKSGGDFPYLSRNDEFTMLLQVFFFGETERERRERERGGGGVRRAVKVGWCSFPFNKKKRPWITIKTYIWENNKHCSYQQITTNNNNNRSIYAPMAAFRSSR